MSRRSSRGLRAEVGVRLVGTQGGAVAGFWDTMMGSLTHSCSNGAVLVGVRNQKVVVLDVTEVAYVQFIIICHSHNHREYLI